METEIKKFSYKKDLKFDLALGMEVDSINPYSVSMKKGKSRWEEVASNLRKID